VKASEIIDRQNLPDANEKAWKEIYRTFLNLPPKVQPDLEVFTDLPALTPLVERQGTDNDATRIVFRILNEMSRVEVGLIRKDVRYSAIVRHKVENNSRDNLSKFVQLERESISLIRESAPDVEIGEYWPLNLRSLISRLHELEFNWCLTEHVHRLLGVIRLDGTGFSSRTNSRSLVPKELGHGQFRIKLERSWDNIEELSRKRVAVAGVLLECIHGKIPAKAPASATLQVDFDETDLLDAIKSDITLGPEISDAHAAIEHGLRYLHEMGVIQLKGGIALITQAMRLDLEEASLNRQYKKVDHDTLEVHYTERNLQIHVMAEYAMLAEKKLEEALGLVVDYFNLDKTEFIKKHFQGRKKLIELATSVESYNRIIESLNNRHQQAIVASPVNRNLLVLAGPGSGKTRVVAHRCAYLLRVKRIKPAQLLVLCYNRSAAITLRRRIHDLAGTDSSGITICTFHSLALRLLGISAADTFPRGAEHDQETQSKFQEIIPRATALLDGVAKVPGMDKEQIFNSLIGSWSHFLIDEYQDVDEQQYAFISAIAGRVTKNPDTKLSIMAVGDDDQNIYNFRGASTRFIRSFEEDYKAKTEHLTENYRSTTNIISASNHLIEQNRDRMKTDHPIIINRARSDNPKGGEWEKLDSVGKGFVQVLPTADLSSQTTTIVSEIKRLREISPGEVSWNDFAVLGRGRPQLTPIRALLESEELPVQWACGLHHGIPLSRLREIQEGFDTIIQRKDDDDKSSSLTAQELLELFPEREEQSQSPWQKLFGQLLLDWCREIGESSVDLDNCMHFLYEALMQMRNEHRHGDGVYVGTAHGAKGLEFKHVFIADGGWETREESLEEERRLYYVAMTRAMENLLLLSRGDRQDNFADVISGAEGAIVRAFSEATASDPNILSRRYDFLGMKDLYLDLGSRDRSVREAVGKLRTDDPLFMRETEDRVSVFDVSDQRVATLSAGASAEWKPRLADVESAKVFAIARRHRDDCSPEYRDQCIAETWEVPLVEVVLNESTTEPAN
jgi:ATP-dependent DNA helicase RecQ